MKLEIEFIPEKIIVFLASTHAIKTVGSSNLSPSNGETMEETPSGEEVQVPSGGETKIGKVPPRG